MAKKLLKKQLSKRNLSSKRAMNSKKTSTTKSKSARAPTKKTAKKIKTKTIAKKKTSSSSAKEKKSRKTPVATKKSSSKASTKAKKVPSEKQKKIKDIKKPLKEVKKRKPRAKKVSEVIIKTEEHVIEPPRSIEKAVSQAIPKNQYFTKTHEQAILKYATSTDRHEKSVLYISLIQPAFNELVDKIVFTYKFTSLPNIEDLKDECKIWLTTILDKFDVSKGSKAFSYFSVITKNWFIHKVKKNSSGKEVGLEDISQEFEEDNLYVTNGYEETREKDEFWDALWQEMDSWSQNLKKQNEKVVYDAIKQLILRKEEIEIFNKKAIYLYIREMTGLSTKQIVSSLNKFKTVYVRFVRSWNSGEHKKVNRNVEPEKNGKITE